MKKGLWIKRGGDIVIGLLLLIALFPLFCVIAILIKVDSKGSVLFLQERAGIDGKPFVIWKFRTMCNNAVNMGDGYDTEENDFRITRVGKILRNFSLDELPQLINIIKGDMSIVGPRPTLMYQIAEYDSRQMSRLKMRPGLTGWAQIHGRNSLSWPERIEYDIWYVENWRLKLDIKILFNTILVVLKQEGIYSDKDKFAIQKNDINA